MLLGAAGLLALSAAVWWRAASSDPFPRDVGSEQTTYVGSETCAGCHSSEAAEWRPSQHARAMAEATEQTVAGNFDGAQVTHGGVTSTFFKRDGKFFVRTDGADAHLAEFEITYTFGVEPLQQYLIALPGGRLQALSLAWDTRPAAERGQRWFHLYPDETIKAGDPLHWTGYQQNWNFMCADCHSTNVRKGYDVATRQYHTTWSEISVGCESCHGPGSEHVARARTRRFDEGYGLTAQLTEREEVRWSFDAKARLPVRSQPRATDREIEVCARCHARRAQLTDDWKAGDPLENGFRPSLVESPLYHVDGQQREEVYNHASFLQSRMNAAGVTCSDCHNPHTGTLRLPGNATCTQCHQNPRYDSSAHHFHQPNTPAAACATCHMPTTTYMAIDPRHDHSFRVPRPDLTATLGAPNPCTTCHTDRTAAWAAAEIQRRTGRAPVDASVVAHTFAASDRNAPDSAAALWRLAADRQQPDIVRGSAVARIAADAPSPGRPIEVLLRDPSPMVRRPMLQVVRSLDPASRVRLAAPLLTDLVRTVRIEAASTLADVADRMLTGADRARFESAFAELVAEQRFNADRPEAQTNLGVAWMARGRTVEAAAAFEEAIALDPTFTAASVNLADLHRAQGNDRASYETLRRALDVNPANADVHHALGLALVRQKRLPEAIEQLERAARLAPASARYHYVYAVALNDAGRGEAALQVLRASLARHPNDADTLMALVTYNERAGRLADAAPYAERLLALRPQDPDLRALAARLGGRGSTGTTRP